MAIINHYKEHGAVATSRQYDVSTGMIYNWVSQFDETKKELSSHSDYQRVWYQEE
jgi:transposase-like protein